MEDKRLALLIDADNISSKYVKTIFEESTNEGVITYKRIYGDWTKPNLESWKDVLLTYSITPMQQYSYTSGKTSTVSAMIIDAMDILYTKNVDGFILVSSDSDFTKLATRLKESAMLVIGMGKQQTPKPFVTACTKFKYLDILSENEGKEKKEENIKSLPVKAEVERNVKEITSTESSQTPLKEVLELIRKLMKESSDDGWILASSIGSKLLKIYPDFDVRNYGFQKLIDFLNENGFETKKYKDPNNVKNPSGYVVYARIKQKI